MGHVIEVTDPVDPRVADYRALTDVELRRRFEPPHGLFIAEGELVIRRAVRAGYQLRSLLLAPKWLTTLEDLPVADTVPAYVAGPGVIEALTGFHVHRGALASVNRRPLSTPGELLRTARRVVVLEDVNTHTNVGAIFRCAAGLGMDAVLLSPRCADPLYRRSVRVSMGEVFAVPYTRLADWPAGLADVRRAGFQLLALTPERAAAALDDLALATVDKVAVLLGAEGSGLSAAARTAADELVRIPMARGVDSLNVAAAAAVVFYALQRASPATNRRAQPL